MDFTIDLWSKIMRYMTPREVAMACGTSSAFYALRDKAQMPSLLDWLKGFPALPDPPAACADKLMKAGYRSVEDIVDPDSITAEMLMTDSGISGLTAIIIHIAAQEARRGLSGNQLAEYRDKPRKRSAADAGLDLGSPHSELHTRDNTTQCLSMSAGTYPSRSIVAGEHKYGTYGPLLMRQFGERVRRARSGPLPRFRRMLEDSLGGASAKLEGCTALSECLVLEGRGSTFTQWLYWTANAFWGWTRSKTLAWMHWKEECGHTVAQLHLLGTASAGKSTELEMLPHQLSGWLQTGDEACLLELQTIMHPYTSLTEKEVAMSEALLAALKRAAGRIGQYNTFLPVMLHKAPDAHLENRDGLSSHAASAVRLLYAATQPLEESPDSTSYEQFYMSLGASMRKHLRVRDVSEFLRLALEVPAEEHLMLQPLINQAHLATGNFGTKDWEEVTWCFQFMSEINTEMYVSGISSSRTFVLPVTAATHFAASKMRYTQLTRCSITARLDLKLLTNEQNQAAVKGLACQVARANGRTAPLTIPTAVTKIMAFVGSSPHLLTLVMECVGGLKWQEELDQSLAAIGAPDVLCVLTQVRDRAHTGWNTILRSVDPLVKHEIYMTLLANVLADTPVAPSDEILRPFRSCCPTYGDLEAASIVYFEIEDEIGHLQGKVSSLSWIEAQLVRASNPSSEKVRISMPPLVVAELLRDLNLVDENFSDVVDALMMQDSSLDRAFSDACMLALRLEAYRLQKEKSVGLYELLPELQLPFWLDMDADFQARKFLIPQGHLTVLEAQRDRRLTLAWLKGMVQDIKCATLASMQAQTPALQREQVVIGSTGLGSKGALSVLVFLDEQQMPWTFFIHTQQPGDNAVKTLKDVLCHLEDDLKELVTLPEFGPGPPAWNDWHRAADDVPTEKLQARSAVAAEQSTKLPFSRIVYMYVSNSMFPLSENHVYQRVEREGHPWLQHTIIVSSHIRKAYRRRIGALAGDALRHAMLDKFLYGQRV